MEKEAGLREGGTGMETNKFWEFLCLTIFCLHKFENERELDTLKCIIYLCRFVM